LVKLILLLQLLSLSISCSTNSKKNNKKYIWDEGKKHQIKYYEEMDADLGRKAKAWFESIIDGKTTVYAGAQALGFYNGEKLKIKKIFVKKAPGNKGTDGRHRLYLGFEKPQYPISPKEISDRVRIDYYDYYVRVYLEVQQANNNKLIKELPFDLGVHFYCKEANVEKKCRDTKITPFFNEETYFSGNNYLAKNLDRDIVGMYFKWKPKISKIHFSSVNPNKKIYFEDFLAKLNETPHIMNSVKYRLVAIGMTKEQVTLAIGNGDNTGIHVSYGKNGKVTQVHFNPYKRSKALVD
jgi:hypothetical protein